MKLYWTLASIDELSGLSLVEAKKAWRVCYPKSFTHWQTWVGLLVLGVPAGIGAISGYYVSNWLGMRYPLFGLIGASMGGGIGGFCFLQILVQQMRPYLRAYVDRYAQARQIES